MEKEIAEGEVTEATVEEATEAPKEQTPEELAQELEATKQKECAEKIQVILDSYGYQLAITGFTLAKKLAN
jgi:ribonuclease D